MPTRKTPTWLAVTLIVSCVFILFLFTYNGTEPHGPTSSSPVYTNQKTDKMLTRDEFTRLIYLKTQEEVLKLVGKPIRTGGSNCLDSSPPECSSQWYYQNKSYDPITGKPDYFVQVNFVGNRVESINF